MLSEKEISELKGRSKYWKEVMGREIDITHILAHEASEVCQLLGPRRFLQIVSLYVNNDGPGEEDGPWDEGWEERSGS